MSSSHLGPASTPARVLQVCLALSTRSLHRPPQVRGSAFMTHVPLRSSHALGGPGCPYLRPTVYTSEGSREALGLRDCGSGRRDQREHCASSQLYREDAARGRAGAETPGRRPARSRAQGSRASLRGVQACRPGPRGVWHTRPCARHSVRGFRCGFLTCAFPMESLATWPICRPPPVPGGWADVT